MSAESDTVEVMFDGLPDCRFKVILMDPPWLYYGSPNKYAAAGKHYDCVDTATLTTLPIPDLLDDPGVVFCWTTSTKIPDALALFKAWGLSYRGVAFEWIKVRRDGGVIGGQGPRPSITKPNAEYVFVASRKRRGRPLPLADESVHQVVLAPRGAHSAKPVEVHRRIESMYPSASKLEMFARRAEPGWECWGDQLL